tara:strand:- start:2238 stop:2519 length:282 start_codon:yes stop_codon:yes gene_type:complete
MYDVKDYRFGEDDGDEPSHVVTLASVVLTNTILDGILNDITDRLIMVDKLSKMALDLDNDEVSVRFIVKAIRKITTQQINTNFLIIDEDPDDE